MKKHNKLKKIISVLLVLTIVVGSGGLAYGLVADYYGVDSVYALSKLGSSGEEVKRVQNKLKELGYYGGKVDGIYGSGTKNAVTKFQKSVGISSDGICGPKTLLYLGLDSSPTTNNGNTQFSSSDVQLLAKVISAEARGESYEGQVAVGAVILNRISHPSFPDSLSGVVYQNGAFSCVNDSNWYQPVSEVSKKAAIDAINGWDPSGGAVFYYNPAKTNDKFMHSRPVLRVIGSHRFCS